MTAHFKPPLLLEINPDIDIEAHAKAFRKHGQVRIPRLFSHGAPDLFHHLTECRDWIQLANKPAGGAYELDWESWTDPASGERARLSPEIFANATDGFQYSYAALLADPALLATLTAITGIAKPRFTDGQVTAYGEGDFLTGHDDDLAGSGRRAAFVLGLTPQWRLEWGGLLMFHKLGQVGFSGRGPQFNTLDLFRVPIYHSVSLVSPAAPRRRFSVTGWLSAKD
jgi:SM-20-related protein